MSEIQQARDVLAKWREKAAPGPWEVNEPIGELNRRLDWVSIDATDDVEDPRNVTYEIPRWETRLIVGTAGNPDLLDAIDKMLGWIAAFDSKYVSREFGHYAATIAAAIIAAEERMRS